MMDQNDESEAWARGDVSPKIVSFSDEAQEWIIARAAQNNDDQISTAFGSLAQAMHDQDWKPAETRGPRIGFGPYVRDDLPENSITNLFGVDLYLRMDPNDGDRSLNSDRVWIENDRMAAEFDPPPPERPIPIFAQRIDRDTGRRIEGDKST